MQALRDPLAPQILLDRNFCYQGTPLTGSVTLETHGRSLESYVNVYLEGRAKAKVVVKRGQSTHTYRSRAPLLQLRRVLQPVDALGGNRGLKTWHFALDIPETVQEPRALRDKMFNDADKGGSGYWDAFTAHHNFNIALDQPLPPNYGFGDRESIMGPRMDAYVSYTITAAVYVEGKIHKSQQPVQIMPPPIISLPKEIQKYQRPWWIQTLHLLPDHPPNQSLSFKDGLKNMFKTESVPHVLYDVHLERPQATALGESMFLTCRLTQKEKSPQLESLPEVRLLAVRARIRAQTRVRTIGAWSDRSDGDDKEVWRQGAHFFPDPKIFKKSNDHTITVETSRLVGTVPDFTTYNVGVRHAITITWELQCAGKTESERCTGPIAIFSGVQGGGQAEQAGPSDAAGPDGFGDIGDEEGDELEQLPTYEEAVEEGPSRSKRPA